VLSINGSVSEMDMQSLFQMGPETALGEPEPKCFAQEQRKDGKILAITQYLEKKILPESTMYTCQIAAQAPLFTLIDEILYYLDDKQPEVRHIAVPKHLRKQIFQEYHSGNIYSWSFLRSTVV